MAGNIEVRRAVPEWLHVQVNTWQDLRELGRGNVTQLIRYQRSDIRSRRATLARLDQYAAVLEGKNGADITEEAKKYANPEFTSDDLTLRKDGFGMNPGKAEPAKAEDISRERGETTFNKCGWCEFAGTGSMRFNYMIDGNCSLLSYANLEFNNNRGVTTPCDFKKMSGDQIGEVVSRYREEQVRLREGIQQTQKLAERMRGVARRAEDRPMLPQLRPHDFFNLGDEVVTYVGPQMEDKLVGDPRFITAKVIPGYRHHDGCVSYVSDEQWHKGDYYEGRGGGSGVARADILPKREFDYLVDPKNENYLYRWLNKLNARDKGYGPFAIALFNYNASKQGGK